MIQAGITKQGPEHQHLAIKENAQFWSISSGDYYAKVTSLLNAMATSETMRQDTTSSYKKKKLPATAIRRQCQWLATILKFLLQGGQDFCNSKIHQKRHHQQHQLGCLVHFQTIPTITKTPHHITHSRFLPVRLKKKKNLVSVEIVSYTFDMHSHPRRCQD